MNTNIFINYTEHHLLLNEVQSSPCSKQNLKLKSFQLVQSAASTHTHTRAYIDNEVLSYQSWPSSFNYSGKMRSSNFETTSQIMQVIKTLLNT